MPILKLCRGYIYKNQIYYIYSFLDSLIAIPHEVNSGSIVVTFPDSVVEVTKNDPECSIKKLL